MEDQGAVRGHSPPGLHPLPSQTWYDLSPAGRRTWDTLTEEDKSVLIGNLTNCTQKFQQKQPATRNPALYQPKYLPTPTPTRKANVHESGMSDMERFQAAFHAFCMNNRDINKTNIDTSAIGDNDPEELHAFMAQKAPKKTNAQQHKSPGNINRLLSPPRLNKDVT